MGLCSVKVTVPDAKYSQDDWDVLLNGCGLEMVVHPVSSRQHMLKVIKPNIECNGHANGRPQGVPASNPVPECEHVGLVDTEFLDKLCVGGKSNEVFSYEFRVLGRFQEPLLGSVGVGDGLLGGEGLDGDHKQGGLSIQLLQDFSCMGSPTTTRVKV